MPPNHPSSYRNRAKFSISLNYEVKCKLDAYIKTIHDHRSHVIELAIRAFLENIEDGVAESLSIRPFVNKGVRPRPRPAKTNVGGGRG